MIMHEVTDQLHDIDKGVIYIIRIYNIEAIRILLEGHIKGVEMSKVL